MMRKKKILRIAFCLVTAASAVAAGLGAAELLRVDRAMKAGIAAAKSEMEGTAAVVSFVEGSAGNVTVYEKKASMGDAVAILTFRFPREDIEVAVFDGTSAQVLENGAGRTVTSAEPNGEGRCILHGHRDSAFSPMARMEEGDLLLLSTAEGTVTYQAKRIYVTEPTDPKIYETSETRQLELVTCYPFSFVGPAPDRCVVIAEELKQ